VITFKGHEVPIIFTEGAANVQNKAIEFSYTEKNKNRKKNSRKGSGFDLSLLVIRENMCKTKKAVIKLVGQSSFTFIQMDKPIYKPGDTVQFRVIVIDPTGLPYQVNSILITIFDQKGVAIIDFKRHQDMINGIFETSFELGDNINVGNYKVSVILDGKKAEETEKIFSVQKYTLPFFQVHIDAPKMVFFEDKQMDIRVYAKYSFEEFVNGNMKLTIRNAKNKTFYEKSEKVYNSITKTFEFEKDFKFKFLIKETDLIVDAEMTDEASGTTMSTSKVVKILPTKKYKIDLYPRFPYEPGLTYYLDVVVSNWNGDIIGGGTSKVKLSYKYQLKGYVDKSLESYIVDSLASFKIKVPKGVATMDIQVEYLGTVTKMTLSKDVATVDAIRVFESEDSPKE
jgi:CD109 antigen